jgi:hypothetical protein
MAGYLCHTTACGRPKNSRLGQLSLNARLQPDSCASYHQVSRFRSLVKEGVLLAAVRNREQPGPGGLHATLRRMLALLASDS